jgi:hypothetical protein
MKNLSEIIEMCKLNQKPEYEELFYAVLSLTSVANMLSMNLRGIEHNTKEFILNFKKDNMHTLYHNALNKSPKEFIGWNYDPANPEYQKFHAMGNKLVDMALNKKLPNQ